MKILGLCDISKVCCFKTWLILVDFISENVIFDIDFAHLLKSMFWCNVCSAVDYTWMCEGFHGIFEMFFHTLWKKSGLNMCCKFHPDNLVPLMGFPSGSMEFPHIPVCLLNKAIQRYVIPTNDRLYLCIYCTC